MMRRVAGVAFQEQGEKIDVKKDKDCQLKDSQEGDPRICFLDTADETGQGSLQPLSRRPPPAVDRNGRIDMKQFQNVLYQRILHRMLPHVAHVHPAEKELQLLGERRVVNQVWKNRILRFFVEGVGDLIQSVLRGIRMGAAEK